MRRVETVVCRNTRIQVLFKSVAPGYISMPAFIDFHRYIHNSDYFGHKYHHDLNHYCYHR